MADALIFPGNPGARTGRFKRPSLNSVANVRYTGKGEDAVPYVYYAHGTGACDAAGHQGRGDVPLAIVAHGNAELMNESQAQFLHDYFIDAAVDVAVWEYAGYGVRADEAPSQEAIKADALRIAEFFKRRKAIFVGRSLGGYGAIVAAVEHQRQNLAPSKLFLLSAFASACRAKRITRLIAGTRLDSFRNDVIVRAYRGDVFLVHGSADTEVRPDNLGRLYDACVNARRRVRRVVTGGGHNGLVPFLQVHIPVRDLIDFSS